MKLITTALTCLIMPVYLTAQCTLANYSTAFKIPSSGYPYFSAGSGVTVSASTVNVPTLSDVAYTCGANTYAGSTPAWWLNSATGAITLNFSAPVSNLTVLVNGTNTTEVFNFAAATGVITLSNYCGHTATGASATCNSASTVGSIFTINNPTGSTQYVITHNGLGSGSRVTLLDCFKLASVLPIELKEFKASCKAAELVEVEWTTSAEINNDLFSLEKSADAKVWEEATRIKSDGYSRGDKKYSYGDNSVTSEVVYYRLKQIDKDGQYRYSKTITVYNCSKNTYGEVSVFPNPAENNVTIEGAGIQEVRIVNKLGELMMNVLVTETENDIDISSLAPGVYFLTAKEKTIKIVKN